MNWIQQYIFVELTRYSTRRYTELRPDGVEGNLFSYHLNGLIKDHLVEKSDQRYRLTTKGLQQAGTLSLETGRARRQPKILTAVVARNEAGEYLMAKWQREPNTGQISFPHGMMHFGETIADMAALELAEKAGLVGELTYIGEAYIRGYRGDELDRHMLVHLFEAANVTPGRGNELRPEISQSFWSPLDTLKREDFVPGFFEISELARDAQRPIFAEISVSL